MKRTITMVSLVLAFAGLRAQTVADFEGLTLGTDTFYENHSGLSWSTNNATFRYAWDTAYGGFWSSGFSYTNKNNTVTPTYQNMYAAITGKGFNNSNKYVTAWAGYGDELMMIKMASTEKSVVGFYVTNSTYGYKTMKNGGGPARAFGDTLHTHSGMQPGNYPDWFKLTVKGYKNGSKKTDSVEFYLADYRFTDNSKDYIVNTWEWVDCSRLGAVDSIFFAFYSSDSGAFGINNPTYFCMDNFTTTSAILTGISETNKHTTVQVGPNPFENILNIRADNGTMLQIRDISGKELFSMQIEDNSTSLNLESLQSGIYFLELTLGERKQIRKLMKN